MPKHETIVCPRCLKDFECKMGSILICHCSDIHLSDKQRAFIAERWDRCLCNSCLKEISEMPL
ncbi:cysteine-rich CWC family protein [Agarilytica rhodophyticola]|uniref:cysteine-rich CWC family protein n=1 Tax=Agarilytica rhodophyticola TaxID=1737490 RepID=UPI000CD9B2CF